AVLAALSSEPPASPPAPAGKAGATAAERRQLTVMFCDIVGSTALAGSLDPEDFGRILGAFQMVCTESVQRFGGSVAKFMGDGVLVFFGFPVAHEGGSEWSGSAVLDFIAEHSYV